MDKLKYYFLFLFFILLVGGCNQKASYSPGLYTQKVFGKVQLQNQEKQLVIVLARLRHRTFLEQNQAPLFTETAKLLYPDIEGNYNFSFPDEVTEVSLSFFSKHYQLDSVSFQKTLGVGEIQYNTELKPSKLWRNDFVLLIRPYLSGFILEKRYKMSDSDQLHLGEWLSQLESDL